MIRYGDTNYSVTDDGRVYSHLSHRFLQQYTAGKGYKIVDLYIGGNRTRAKRYVHRLVAELYVPNPDGKPNVNHKDGNKSNNHADNLEWVTTSENNQHAYDTGLNRVQHEHPAEISKLGHEALEMKRKAKK